MLKSKLGILCFLILTYFVATARADCEIHVEGGAPIVRKNFGRRTISLPLYNQIVPLKVGETINVYCSKGLRFTANGNRLIEENEGISAISIECSRDYRYERILYNVLYPPNNARQDVSTSIGSVNCISNSNNLFESNTALPNCENYTTFGIGTVLKSGEQLVEAGICFDFETLSTKYVKYLARHSKLHFSVEYAGTMKKNRSTTHITDLSSPVESLEILFFGYTSGIFDIGLKAKQQQNLLLGAHEFEFLDLVQNTQLASAENFPYLLNTVWWRNLRLGNWKIFLNALVKRTEDVKYIVYTGTSGNFIIPSMKNCSKSEVFKIQSPFKSFDVPEIIWAYLKPVKADENDEFVVFGYNTPFYSANNETIICEDICNDIDWLYNGDFGKIHLLPAFGVVHCCRPQDVATKLDNFPLNEIAANPVTTELLQVIDDDDDW